MSSYKSLLLQREEQNLSDFKFYGIEPQSSAQAVMLDVRFGNGNFQALPYSYMTRIRFNPSEGIEVFVSDVKLLIIGRNMNTIYNYLVMHRLTYIQESLGDLDDGDENEVFIEKIDVFETKDMD